MSDDDLKPCPFCGGVPELVDDRVGFFVRCQHCTPHWTVRYGERVPIDEQETDVAAVTLITSTDWNAVRQSAIDAWNRRAPDAAAPDIIEALRPFAHIAEYRCADAPVWRDQNTIMVAIRIGDLRRALAAIAKAEGRG